MTSGKPHAESVIFASVVGMRGDICVWGTVRRLGSMARALCLVFGGYVRSARFASSGEKNGNPSGLV